MNNIRQAIFKAADHIERNPLDFNFHRTVIPSCGTPGCALGWIGCFAGFNAGGHIAIDGVITWFNRSSGIAARPYDGGGAFYDRMDRLSPREDWRYSHTLCAATLRLYADKYHPAESRALIPASVMAIFNTPQKEPSPASAAEWMEYHDRVIAALKSA